MIFDLRSDGLLTIEQAEYISQQEPLVRKQYNEYIGDLVHSNNVKGLAWLTQVTCRNTHVSLIHDRMCRILMLSDYLGKGCSVELVKVDSYSMKEAVQQVLDSWGCKATIEVFGNPRARRYSLFFNLLRSLYLVVSSWLWPKIMRGKKECRGEIYYLDNFLLLDSFDEKGRLKDRYYPGLVDNLPDAEKEKVWYAPTFHGIKTPAEYWKLFRAIRSSETRFLLMQDWLKLSDYLYSIFQSLFLYKSISSIPLWKGYDISSIVQEEINVEIGKWTLVSSILRYRFIKRLAEHGIQIKLVIDWFENQVIDRALNLAINKYYPGVWVKGYHGAVVEGFYASIQPTCYERDGGTLPNEVCVIGNAFVERRKEYCPDLKVSVAPAFRFQSTLNYVHLQESKKNIILLALPIYIDMCQQIIRMCVEADVGAGYEFVIKQHPTYTKNKFIALVPEALDKRFFFSSKTLYELFTNTALLVSTGSSVCFEAVACDIPVAICGGVSGPTMNPLDGLVDNRNWRVCYTPTCIENMLNACADIPRMDMTQYLSPVTQESVRAFIEY